VQVEPSRQSPQAINIPGQHVLGMDHTKQLTDVLYQRWAEGLRNRWPGV
jgi:serine/threonine-protein kinase 24/25/MST4